MARWVAICGGPLFLSACALFDQPPPEPPPKGAPAQRVSKYEPLAAACQCGVERSEKGLRAAITYLGPNSTYVREAEGFATCTGALTGVPTPISPDFAGPRRAMSSFAALDRMAEHRDLSWRTWIASYGPPLMRVKVSPQLKNRDPDRYTHVTTLTLELGDRMEPVGRALKDAHLSAQLCHATALFVALDAEVGNDRSSAGVVRRSANFARIGDGVAAAATGLVLTLSRAAAERGGDVDSRLARFQTLGFEGEFDSDADDVARLAARHAKTLETSSPSDGRKYSRDVALPLWLAPRPTLLDLCQPPDPTDTQAAQRGLAGLREGDLDRMMVGARFLRPKESSARHGMNAICSLIRGDERQALSHAREMVPGYSATGTLLTSMSQERP
jgi:hypothetical protein